MTIREDADLHRAQRAFRCVLDAFAHPGTVHQLVPAPENPASPVALDASLELVVRLFVDQAVTFCVADSESDAVAAYLTSETHARRVSLRDADFVVVPARADAQTVYEAVAEACRGTLVSPEKGATVLVGCARLADAPDAATNPAPGLDPSTDPASMFHVKQSTQCSATKEQMFHVKHSEPVPAMPGASGASPRAEISVGAGCCPPAGAQQGAPTQSPDNATPAAPVAAVAPAMPAAPAATAASAAKGVR